MADYISQITLPNNTTYNIKDSLARTRSIEYIRGTWTEASGTWTGISQDPSLYDGKQIILYMPFAGNGNATLNLTLNGGEAINGTIPSTGAKNVYFEATTRFTTHKEQNSQLHLIYHSGLQLSNGTTYEGWWYVANRDTASATDNILDGSNSGTAITYAPYNIQQSKLSFDTSSTNPDRTDRLNLNGYLYATKLYSGGTEVSVNGHIHSYAGSSTAGGAANSANKLNQTTATALNTFTDASALIYTSAGGSNNLGDKPTGVDAFGLLSFKTANGYYGQLLMSSNTASGLYWRTDTTLSGGWNKILDSNNYTDYTVTKTGTGASGTWGISISGSAGEVAWDNVSDKPASATRWPKWNEITQEGADSISRDDSDATASTELLTSYASNSGFSDTNGKGRVYKRYASHIVNATLVKAALGTNSTHGDLFLRKDGTWTAPPYPVTSVAGLTGAIASASLREELGLSKALTFIGTVASNSSYQPTEETTTSIPTITGVSPYTPAVGDVILDKNNDAEYVCVAKTTTGNVTSYTWELLGRSGSWALYDHVHGNITNGGLLTEASVAVVTDSNKKITTANLTVNDSSASTNATTTFVQAVTQSAQGKITVTKAELNTSGTWSGTATHATTTPSTNAMYLVGVASGATTTLLHDTSISIDKGKITIGVKESGGTAPSSETTSDRIIITPYHHTGPWKISSADNSTNAFLKLSYGNTELIKIKDNGNTDLSGTLTVTGATTLNNTLSVGSTLTVTGVTTLNSTLSVSSTSTLTGKVGIGCAPDSATTGDQHILKINGSTLIQHSGNDSAHIDTSSQTINNTAANIVQFYPTTNARGEIGKDGNRWRNGYFSHLLNISDGTSSININTNDGTLSIGIITITASVPTIQLDTLSLNEETWTFTNNAGNFELTNSAGNNKTVNILGTDNGWQLNGQIGINTTPESWPTQLSTDPHILVINGSTLIKNDSENAAHLDLSTETINGNNYSTIDFYPETNKTGQLGLSDNRWSKVYLGDAVTYGDKHTPIYWNDGVPYQVPVVQQYDFTIASGSTSTTITLTNTYNTFAIVDSIVVTSGLSYLKAPLSWNNITTNGTVQIQISTTAAIGGTNTAISGYILVSTGIYYQNGNETLTIPSNT